jgi:hypothetical protein
MKKGTIFAIFCGAAGLALSASSAWAGALANGVPVDVVTTVNDIREVPAGNPLPGLHIDARVNGKMMDIYIAPMDFVTKFGLNVAKGADVHISGTESKSNEADVVVAKEVETGVASGGRFHPKLTIYLRNADGPFWVETPTK